MTSAEMPSLIYKACVATNTVSNTVYIQHAVAEALSRDLGIPVEQIKGRLPTPRATAKHLFQPRPDVIGPAGTNEEVR